MMQFILSIELTLFLYFNGLLIPVTPTRISTSDISTVYSVAYELIFGWYHEKYHVQKNLIRKAAFLPKSS
jgi:hypothetical protein